MTNPSVDLEIAPITENDYDGAAAAIASGLVFQWYGMTHPVARDFVVRAATDSIVVVARVGGRVVGVAIFRADGPMPVRAYLRVLAVAEGSRGQGVGRALLRYVEEQAFQQGPNLFLLCVDRNTDARRFYEREGYHLVGALPDLGFEGITELLYRKTLGPIRGYVPRSNG